MIDPTRAAADERYCDTDEIDVERVDQNRAADIELWPPPADPMAVARAAVIMWTRGDVAALRFWRAGWMTWLPSGQWVEVERSAISATLYECLEHAFWAGPRHIEEWRPNRKKMGDLLDALSAITFLPETVDPPAWLDGTNGPPPGEVVACTNGLLHVTTRQLYGHDPRFFTRMAVPFAYEADGPEPERWLSFLDELWPGDAEAIAALQEWFGYTISGRTDLHKILLLVGPMRSGKGTIARVLTALVGRPNVAGPTPGSHGCACGSGSGGIGYSVVRSGSDADGRRPLRRLSRAAPTPPPATSPMEASS
jgi:putative DNA primase/helicase